MIADPRTGERFCPDCAYGFGGGETWECLGCHAALADLIALDDAVIATGERAIYKGGVVRTAEGWRRHWAGVFGPPPPGCHWVAGPSGYYVVLDGPYFGETEKYAEAR